ncbi:DUF5697 family protein [Anaerocolumna xylanovorans]|uniref:Uncharacterized protein n=1 Tax=Anaerocolumna xylanovorans DSM 12503 TaxID=1121345 RepID=A0A1M7Y0U5_9FIRM|nr:DUF5697 family protein [Anaerocolumna xylanovorans]SHO45224.1 hypothetical protein SAMN02745217_00877 [Anaerocolumna xylanovorans DSM 12503]
MKTREDMYSNEAKEIVRVITLYKTLTSEQVYRLFPGKESSIKNLLSVLIRQGRFFYNPTTGRLSANQECESNPDMGMIAAFWVLLDFIARVEYHTASDFPVKISFFCDGEMYEIIHVPYGQEILIGHAVSCKEEARRIILVESPEQIETLHIPGVSGFCTVGSDGSTCYYKLE